MTLIYSHHELVISETHAVALQSLIIVNLKQEIKQNFSWLPLHCGGKSPVAAVVLPAKIIQTRLF